MLPFEVFLRFSLPAMIHEPVRIKARFQDTASALTHEVFFPPMNFTNVDVEYTLSPEELEKLSYDTFTIRIALSVDGHSQQGDFTGASNPIGMLFCLIYRPG